MEVRLFGELEAVQGDVAVPVRGAKQRALLALLVLHRGEPVSADRLIDMLWGDGQAANPANALQAQIGQLRRTLGADAIVTSEAGYALTIGSGDVDVIRFEQLVAKGRRLAEEGEAALASAALGEALGLRRGEPLAEFAYAGFADAERARLDELTLVAVEARAGADLDWAAMPTWSASWRQRAVGTSAARALVGTADCFPVPVPAASPRRCGPIPRSVTAWRMSWASIRAGHCASFRPASWPRIRRLPQPGRLRPS